MIDDFFLACDNLPAMRDQPSHTQQNRPIFCTVFLCAVFLLPAAPARAQTANLAPPLEKVRDFKSQPLAILAKFPKAGPAMASFVAALVARQPQIVDAVLSIAETSTPEQASALGAGLVRAARLLVNQQPTLVTSLSQKIAASKNVWLKTTYTALGVRFHTGLTYTPLPTIPPATPQNLNVRNGAPLTPSRMGPNESTRLIPMTTPRYTQYSTPTRLGIDHTGTLVAIINSDAAESGANSTSPTH